MAEPTIVRGSDHHFSFTYTGTGLGQRVGTFVPFTDNGTISQSLLFNDGNGEYLHRTPGSDGNRRTWTWSAWVRREKLAAAYMFIYSDASANTEDIQFDSSNRLQYYVLVGGSYQINYISNRTFEDKSKWYHIVVRKDTTQSTAADRVRIYVDGDQITSWNTATQPSQNDEGFINQSGKQHAIGNFANVGVSDEAVGHLAEVNFADGQSYGPDTFGITDTTTGVWIPKSLGSITYGTHGYRMQFANSAGQTLGDDTSGQGNDYTVVNVGTDQVRQDSPTQSFTNMNGDNTGGFTIAEGGLNVTSPGSGQYEQIVGLPNFGVATGKWYWELRVYNKGKTGVGWKSDDHVGGASAADSSSSPHTGRNGLGLVYNIGSSGGFADGEITDDYSNAYSDFSTFSAASAGDIVMFAIDLDNSKGYIGLNGTWFNSANPANGTGSIGLSTPATGKNKFYPMMLRLDSAGQNNYNFGQNPTFSDAYDDPVANTASSGPGLFKYTPPTDFLAINRENIPSTNKGIVDFAWADNRASGHNVFRDSSRGDNTVFSPSTGYQASPRGIVEFLQGGYRLDQDDLVGGMDAADNNFVSWNWHANGGTTAANTDGSGATLASTTQANQEAGFSIVTYTGDGNAGRKVAHGLTSAPEFIATKALGSASWYVYFKNEKYDSTPWNRYFRFDSDDSYTDSGSAWNDTAPASSVFTIGDSKTNTNTTNYVAYCWHSVEGYSKIGYYEGSGNATGPYIVTGFKPAWVLIKGINIGNSWRVFDNVRELFNPRTTSSDIDTAGGDVTNDPIHFHANGFKLFTDDADVNGSYAYAYMAFAERPFNGDGTNPGHAG